MGKSREEMFRAAKEKQKEKKVEREQRQNRTYEDVQYTALGLNTDKVIRIVGNPLLMREDSTDPKLTFISMILGDNDKKFRCIWPSKEADPSWILWKVFDKVMSYDYDRTNNQRRYHNVDSHPELFRRVAKNNSTNQYESGWYPRKFVHINVIDRHDMNWHRENQKYKVLSKKASEGANERIYFEPGIPETAYNTIWDDVVEYSGDWQNYDIVLRKLKESPYYSAFHGVDDLKKIQDAVKSVIVDRDITEEELSWDGYDFDKLFPITSYTKILNRLGKFVKKVDLDFNTTYFEELQELSDAEKEEWKANKEEQTDDSDEDESPEEEEKVEEPKPRTRRAPLAQVEESNEVADIPWDDLASGAYNGTEYLGVSDMTDEEKSIVIGVNEDGSFEYLEEWKGSKLELLNNPSSGFISPENFHVDPLSGDLFE